MLARLLNGQGNQSVPFDLKVSLPTPIRPVFIRLIVGAERRSAKRLQQEGQTSKRRVSMAFAVIGWIALASSGFGFFCFAYLVKCAFGINVFSGQSPLHPLYALLFV